MLQDFSTAKAEQIGYLWSDKLLCLSHLTHSFAFSLVKKNKKRMKWLYLRKAIDANVLALLSPIGFWKQSDDLTFSDDTSL